jgi:hypothetical protein
MFIHVSNGDILALVSPFDTKHLAVCVYTCFSIDLLSVIVVLISQVLYFKRGRLFVNMSVYLEPCTCGA